MYEKDFLCCHAKSSGHGRDFHSDSQMQPPSDTHNAAAIASSLPSFPLFHYPASSISIEHLHGAHSGRV